MTGTTSSSRFPVFGQESMRVLIWMRCTTVFVSMAMALVAAGVFGLRLPLLPLAASGALVLVATAVGFVRMRRAAEVGTGELVAYLVIDVVALTAALAATGGPTNPFVSFYLLPLVVSAVVLGTVPTWWLAGVSVACYSALFVLHPGATHIRHEEHDMLRHVVGMWLAVLMIAGLIAYFVTAIGERLREQQRRLSDARAKAARASQLVALGTFAASAAHELGTPLNTMMLLADELRGGVADDAQATLDALLEQLARCKALLARFSASAGHAAAGPEPPPPVDAYLSELIGRWRSAYPRTRLVMALDGARPAPPIASGPSLGSALVNVLDNAAQASPEAIEVSARWTAQALTLTVRDFGPGLSARARARVGEIPYSEKATGMGLGLYLTYRVIERMEGRIRQDPASPSGLSTVIELPLTRTAR